MFRAAIAAIAFLTLGACSYSSAVDIAPLSARASQPVLPVGDYCEVEGGARPFQVVSSDDCVPLSWHPQTRTLVLTDPDGDDDETIYAATTPIGSGVHAAQITVDDATAPHQISLFIAKGEAFASLPVLEAPDMSEIAKRHPKVAFKTGGDGRPYIAAGEIRHIKAYLLDAAKLSLKQMDAENETLSVGVRDRAGAADHAASKAQTRDIEAVIKTAERLGDGG